MSCSDLDRPEKNDVIDFDFTGVGALGLYDETVLDPFDAFK
jgi:hypothetical protein